MSRYTAIANPPSASWWGPAKATDYLPRTVYETESKPVDTGLLDPNGVKLYRIEKIEPIGFVSHHGVKAD